MFDGAAFAANFDGRRIFNFGDGGVGTWGMFGWCATINDGIAGDCNGLTTNAVRYDSPMFGGFSVSATWGEDDQWDVAARYAGEWNGIKLAAAVGYTETTDENLAINDTTQALEFGFVVQEKDVSYFQAGLYAEHVPTGIFGYAAYGKENNDSVYRECLSHFPDPCTKGGDGFSGTDQETLYFKAGLRERWSALGHTVLYGEYSWTDDGIFPLLVSREDISVAPVGITDAQLTRWGFGVVQEIDAAAMSIWLAYRRHEAEVTCSILDGGEQCDNADEFGARGEHDLDAVDIIKFGSLINF